MQLKPTKEIMFLLEKAGYCVLMMTVPGHGPHALPIQLDLRVNELKNCIENSHQIAFGKKQMLDKMSKITLKASGSDAMPEVVFSGELDLEKEKLQKQIEQILAPQKKLEVKVSI